MNSLAQAELGIVAGLIDNMAGVPEQISLQFSMNFLSGINNILLEIAETGGNPDGERILKIHDQLNREIALEAMRHGLVNAQTEEEALNEMAESFKRREQDEEAQ